MFKYQNVFIVDQSEKERYTPTVNRYIVYRNKISPLTTDVYKYNTNSFSIVSYKQNYNIGILFKATWT